MTKKKKWTSWIDWDNPPQPLIGSEVMKFKLVGGLHEKMSVEEVLAVGYDDFDQITHYKRLISNVEAERGTAGERLLRSAKQARAIAQGIGDINTARLDGEYPKLNQALKNLHKRGALSSFSPVSMVYKNHRGEAAARTIIPISVSFTATKYHPESQWILHAFDTKKKAYRDFALRDCNFSEKAKEARNFLSNDDELREVSTKAPVGEVSSWTEASILAYAHYTRKGLIDQIEGFKADLDDAIEVAYHRGADEWTRLNYPDHFERFEKAAQGNALEPMGTKASEPIPTSDDTTPQPVITGVGEYITRDGKRVLIIGSERGPTTKAPWLGSITDICEQASWSASGRHYYAERCHDIIGPWPKPEEEVSTFSVGDQVSKKSGYQYPGKVVSIFETTAGKTRLVVECTCPEVAGMLHIYSPENLLLSHTEGDE